MQTKNTALTKAILEDHREMTRRIAGLLDALKRDDCKTAFQLAEELDRVAGPHIEFEEETFYPLLIEVRGREFVERLYHEHGEGRKAIEALLALKKAGEPLGTVRCKELLQEVQTALDHAGTCGTLLSHVSALDESRQAKLLEKLQEARQRRHHWTELVPRD